MKVIKTKTRRALKNKVIKNNQKLFLLTVVYITGLFFGACTIKNLSGELSVSIQSLMANYYQVQTEQTIFQNFLYTLSSEFLILLIPFVFGLCIIGEPVMWFMPLLRGLGTGLISGYLYKNYSLSGMGYFAAVILIPTVLSSAVMIIGCHESILTTRDIRRVVKNNSGEHDNIMHFYIIRYLVLLVAVVLISLLGAMFVKLFAGKFTLFS